jgi:hypothetical protein
MTMHNQSPIATEKTWDSDARYRTTPALLGAPNSSLHYEMRERVTSSTGVFPMRCFHQVKCSFW